MYPTLASYQSIQARLRLYDLACTCPNLAYCTINLQLDSKTHDLLNVCKEGGEVGEESLPRKDHPLGHCFHLNSHQPDACTKTAFYNVLGHGDVGSGA